MATNSADIQTQYYEPPYMPGPEVAALGCEPFQDLATRGLTQSEFGVDLAETRMVDTAIRLGMADVPDPHFGESVWKERYAQTRLARSALKACAECPLVENCPGAGVLSNIRGEGRPELEQRRMKKLLEVAQTLTEELPNFVLKGGLALTLYGDPRSTIDLDGDIYMPDDSLSEEKGSDEYSPTTEERIRNIVEDAGGTHADKDTDTTLKHSIPWSQENRPMPIKVELRKQEPKSKEDLDKVTALINGIRVYTPEILVDHKIHAAFDRSKARDIFDLSWLVYNIPGALEPISSDALEKLASKLLSTNSAGERIIDETMVADLSGAKDGMPSWVDSDVARKFIGQLHQSIEDELTTRSLQGR